MAQHQFRVHYFNPITRKMACDNFSRNYNQYRLWTENKSEVDCKHCLDVLAKWAEQKARKERK